MRTWPPRRPLGGGPPRPYLPGGLVLSDPLSLLKSEASEWASLWGTVAEPPPRQFQGSCQPLPLIDPEVIRSKSAAYKARTAQAVDGFHMRHYSWLSAPALRVVSLLFAIFESLSSLPRQLQLIQIVLLSKPSGGWRPIGLFVSMYRLWGRCKRDLAAEWEAQHARCFFSLGARLHRRPTRCGGRRPERSSAHARVMCRRYCCGT